MDPVQVKLSTDLPAEVLQTLTEIAQEINSSLNLEEVLARAAASIKKLIDYEIFAVLLPEENTDQLFFRFAIGHRPEVVEHWRIPIGGGIIGAAAATGQPVRVSDVRNDPRYINALDAVQSELAVPLMQQGKVVGVLDIESRQLDYFTPEQTNILVLVASRIASAIENAQLFERTRRQAETLLLLNEVGREANTLLEVEAILRRAAELVKRVIDYQIFSILLYDESAHVFRQRVNVKFGQHFQEKHAVPAHEGIVGAAAALRRPVVVPDVSADPRYICTNKETRSELAVPMIYKSQVVGVLDLESPQLNYFTPDHVQTLSILAASLAVSIENARLYQQVARDEARMDRDLQAAKRLQAALLPRVPGQEFGLEMAAHYISARELGGDLYDFARYGPQELGIAMGDVSGKGTAAALYGAAAIGILRSITATKPHPADLLRSMNAMLYEHKIEWRFMTMCFATWHKGKRKLRLASAGQEQPILWKDGHAVKLKLEGFPLGMYEQADYEEMTVQLDPGDIVVIHSDGFGDTQNHHKEFFGNERLCELVAAHHRSSAAHLSKVMFEEMDKFSGGAPPADDRTLVVLKVL
ncbi:MAG: SpoIIE family protein phosphatase [Candidatus Acidiferrales bacterium]